MPEAELMEKEAALAAEVERLSLLEFSTRVCRQTSTSACSKESRIEPTSEVDYMQATWVLRSWSLGLRSDYADPNRFALAFWILLPRLFCHFLPLEGLRQGRELSADVFEEEPPLSDFGHDGFMARAAAGRSNGLTVPSQRCLDFIASNVATPSGK